ncbi:NB-ARC domain, LRR domain containing protein [Trema orientale]|uniref:NB-ARC domain, LRR domain containing protein n=1 Tax=Trema orientale TaxID=63057 RepID=A0A2P5C060_TREOI|nr:NB-ARC domain, LRR domain containing protein [Trema orientale]
MHYSQFVSKQGYNTGRLNKTEATALSSVKPDVERLRAELVRMQCFLEDADRKQEQDKRVRHWIAEVKDVANDVEDVIEIFISNVSSSYFDFFHLCTLRKQINSIQAKMEDIFKSAQAYRIEFGSTEGTSSVAELQRRLRRSTPDDDEDDEVVSLVDSDKTLKAELMKTEDRLSIVSVVGMGGLGKTTLAKKVYKHNDVKQHFECCAWVFISQQYVTKDTLYEILFQIERDSYRERLRNSTENELSDRIKGELKEKRYIVVLDDIWRIEAWDSIKRAFPKGKPGSKVLFTIRNKEVALSADPCTSPIQPPFLTFEESWELLRRKAFQRNISDEHGLRPEFEKLGKEMVKKCGGLPLAIVVLGGLLRTKNSLDEWKEVQKDVNSHLNKVQSHQEYEGVNGILALSYNDLPYYLKPCFLYLAKQYLGELMDRCLIQVSIRNNSGIGARTYRMHDLLRDLCVSKSRDENFFQIIQLNSEMSMSGAASSNHHNTTTICSRRIVTHGIATHVACDFRRYRFQYHIRSVLCFDISDIYMPSLRKNNLMSLRVLELGGINSWGWIDILNEICKLIHLRYLGLRGTNVSELPNCIRNLQSLHTLDVQGCNYLTLPRGLSRLRHLAHLFTNEYLVLKCKGLAPRIFWTSGGTVRSFVTIRYDTLVKLTNIQELTMVFRSKGDATKVLDCPIIKRGQVRSLDLLVHDEETFPSLTSLSQCRLLYKLSLRGVIEQDNISFLPESIVKLTLEASSIRQDPMAVLEKQPNLKRLRLLSGSYMGSKLVCSAGGFPKLETLRLCHLNYLEEWRMEKDAMPSLQILDLEYVPYLEMIPEGLKFVKTLRQLNVTNMHKSFMDRLRVNKEGIEGEDFYKVRHIPSISFFFRSIYYGLEQLPW